MRATITGCGLALPSERLTNAELEARVDTDDSWIVERTGIRERRVAGPGDTTASLAVDAGAAAIKDAGLTPGDVDLLLLATTTPDRRLPGTASAVQDGLGVRGGAIDMNAACSGFVYALVMGSAMIEAGRSRRVLVVGSEIMQRLVDPTDRGTCVLFGDGAGAVVLEGADGGAGLLGADLGSDGSALSLLEVPVGEQYLKMDGSEVFRRAVRIVVDSARAALADAGLDSDDVDLFVPHQANVRIISAACGRLRIPEDRVMVNIERYGNTSAASVPIALAEAAEQGRLSPGSIVLLSGFGAGMTWGTAVLRWGRP